MGVSTRDVRPGKCFLSEGVRPQVVRVLAVEQGSVRYEARSPTRRRAWAGRTNMSVPDFAAGLIREVSSDYEPSSTTRVHL